MTKLQDEIEMNIRMAVNPSGDPPSLREREQAAQFLLAHANIAYSRIIGLIRKKPKAWEAPRLIELIGRFRRDDSVPLLKDLMLQAIPDTSRAAGRSLGVIASTAAYEALRVGLKVDSIEVIISAIEGVRICGDESWCSAIEPAIVDQDANLRYYAVNAAAELGCLDVERLKNMTEYDDDCYVRQLAVQWLKKSGS